MDAWKLDKLRKYWTWTYEAVIMDKVQQCTIFSHFAKLEKLIKPVTLDSQIQNVIVLNFKMQIFIEQNF